MNLLEKIKAGSNLKKTIKWPGTDEKIQIRLSNDKDSLESTLAADDIFSNTKIGIENLDAYRSEKETQLLFRCILDSDGKPIFKNITLFRDVLTTDIKDVLAEEIAVFEEENNPNPDTMSDAEFDKLKLEVKKNAIQAVSNITNINTVKKLLVSLINQPQK